MPEDLAPRPSYQKMEKRLFKIRVLAAILAFMTVGGAVIFANRKNATPAFRGFSLEESVQEDALTHFYRFEKEGAILKLKVIPGVEGTEAKKMIDGKMLTIEALYGNELSPYPGMISNEIVCSGDMIPKKQEIREGSLAIPYFVVALTDRFAYGNCVESETPYRGIIAWAYCPGKREYRQLELIYPKKEFDENGLEFIRGNICN